MITTRFQPGRYDQVLRRASNRASREFGAFRRRQVPENHWTVELTDDLLEAGWLKPYAGQPIEEFPTFLEPGV